MKCSRYEPGFLWDYKYVVVFARYRDKWIFCRHRERTTWECPGGHIEPGESPMDAAKRELFEETGSLAFDIHPLCDYWACDEPHETRIIGWANGMVFYAQVHTLGPLPESEMAEIACFDTLPAQLTYPDIVPTLFCCAVQQQESFYLLNRIDD